MGPDDPTTVELLLALGLADEDVVRRAVEVQNAAAQLGLPESLFEIISKKKLLAERQAAIFADQVALQALAKPQAATTIPGYRIDSRRGFAGIGVLFEATELASGRPVLLKVLSPLVAAHEALARRFENEIRTVSRLRHPSLPRLVDSGTSSGYRYFAVEGQGRFLANVVERAPLPAPRCLDLAADVCRALAHLATLHLGIRPAALMVRHDGRWVLLDPGATPPPAERVVSFPGVALADPLYGAPEVQKGSTPTIQSDIFSLGATLLTAATGRPPAATVNELVAHVPQPLRPIIEKAMDPDPAKRFAGPDELLSAVEAARKPRRPAPVTVPPAAPPPQCPPPSKGSGGFWTAVLVFLLVTLTVLGVRAFYLRVVLPARLSRRSTAARPEGPKPSRPKHPGAAQRAKTTVRPAAPADAGRAARLAREALAYDRDHAGSDAETLLLLRRALLASGGEGQAPTLEKRRAARQADLDGAAKKTFEALAAKVAALERDDHFGDALKACTRFPAELRHGIWARRLEALVNEVGAAAERRYLALASGALIALLGARYDEALANYERIGQLGIPWMAEASVAFLAAARPYAEAEKKRRAAVAAERARYARRASFAPLQPHFAKILTLVAKHDRGAALAALDAIPKELRTGEPGQAVARLETRLRTWAKVWKLILQGPPSAVGQNIEVYGNKGIIEGFSGEGEDRRLNLLVAVGGARRSIPYPIKKLPPQAIRQLAEWATGGMTPREAALALGLFSLCEGQAAQARAELREAAALGADVQPFLEELEAAAVIRDALDAIAKKEWTTARKLLEEALDGHATTSAVIAAQGKLTSALKLTLAKLGRAPGPPVYARAPLPDALRRLPLLPETRLQDHAPADPLAAYLGNPLVRQGPVLMGLPTWRNYTVIARWRGKPQADFVLAARVSGPVLGHFKGYYVALRGSRLSLWRLDEAGHHALKEVPAPVLRGEGHHCLEMKLEGKALSVAADGKLVLKARDDTLREGRVALLAERGTLFLDGLELYFHPRDH